MGEQLKQTLAELNLRVNQAEEWLQQLDLDLQDAHESKAVLSQRLLEQDQQQGEIKAKIQLEMQAIAYLQGQLEDLQCIAAPSACAGIQEQPADPRVVLNYCVASRTSRPPYHSGLIRGPTTDDV